MFSAPIAGNLFGIPRVVSSSSITFKIKTNANFAIICRITHEHNKNEIKIHNE